jgi:hypothetical protein
VIEEYLDVVAVTVMAAAAIAALSGLAHAPAPAVCKAAEIALQSPGSELVVYGKFSVHYNGRYVYLSCGLAVPRERVLAVERTEGLLRVGSTPDGRLYVR